MTFTAFLVVALVLTGGGFGWWWSQHGATNDAAPGRGGEDTVAGGKIDPASPATGHAATAATPTPGSSTTPAQPAAHRIVYTAKERRVVALVALAHEDPEGTRVHYGLPARYLPLEGGLVEEDGTRVDLQVITWERHSGLVLLMAPETGSPGGGAIRFPTRDPRSLSTGAELEAAAIRATRRQRVRCEQVGSPMLFDPPPLAGSVVVDPEGRGVAYMTDQGGVPLHALEPWSSWWNGRPLEDLQAEIRATDPKAILADARRLLRSKDVTLERATRAIDALEQGRHLPQDPETAAAFDRLRRFGHRQRVRLLSAESGVRALQQVRQSLLTLGDDVDLLSDAVELAIDHGDPRDAIAFFQSLLRISPEHATKIRDRFARKLHDKVAQRLRDDRNQDAAQLLADAVLALPERADLRLQYAQALRKLGDSIAAADQANQAVRLDASYAARARRYLSGTERRGRRRVEIPMSRNDQTIPTTGSAGGIHMDLIVDTGATYTTIPTATAKALGLLNPNNPKVTLTTASGTVVTVRVEIPVLTVAGSLKVRRVKAVVHDLPGDLAGKGLLGLNVLRKLNMRIDSEHNVLILSQ